MYNKKKRTHMKEMTEEEYLNNNAQKCPYCGSDNISANRPEADGRYVWINISCEEINCEKSWTEEFTLSGVTELF